MVDHTDPSDGAGTGNRHSSAGWPLWQQWKRRRELTPKTSPQEAPASRRDAASRSLQSIDRLLDRIEDEITRESLRQGERVEQELNRGDLVVVSSGPAPAARHSDPRSAAGDGG